MKVELQEKIKSAIQYIEDHLKDPVVSDDIAESVAISVRHLQRSFRECTGYTVIHYLRKRRLEQACVELIETKKRILDIAIDYQFQSQEVFTRAFRQRFGLTPRSFRSKQSSTEENRWIGWSQPLTFSNSATPLSKTTLTLGETALVRLGARQ